MKHCGGELVGAELAHAVAGGKFKGWLITREHSVETYLAGNARAHKDVPITLLPAVPFSSSSN